ncbi:microsomal triglyceride transfer protein large subunit isoform X2 [Thrips palmi]|uniref:Microsomal triglyceride transfer protein large subunit isoform X2 n=1 Tax=Thrips palmi TaxID=161013 RepID=A0A6P8ZVU5_THRPL|nr:microsomal triglyceride transfer protein large subunit isoform X2 [Thrips palmi]
MLENVKMSCSMLLLLSVILGTSCQAAPAAAGSARQLEPGVGLVYHLTSTLLLSEPSLRAKDVGYQITADVTIGTVWASETDPNNKLIQIDVAKPQLHIKSRKAPAPEGFVAHSSELENLQNGPYLVHWNNGRVLHMYLAKDETTSISNLKKGISSLLQYQLLDMDTNETDSSGACFVSYKSIDPTTILKTKTDCKSVQGTPYSQHTDKVLGSTVTSKRETRIVLAQDMSALKSVETEETHTMTVNVRPEAASQVHATQQLTLTENTVKVLPIKADDVQSAVRIVEKNSGQLYVQQNLILERESLPCSDYSCPTLQKMVKENREALDEKYLGSIKSASVLVRLLPFAREASYEEFSKVLKNPGNKGILLALCDLAGAAQTLAAHEAIKKAVRLDGKGELDAAERYLWALSAGAQPKAEILTDILQLSEKEYEEEKLSETLLLSVAAVAQHYLRLPNSNPKLGKEVFKSLSDGLARCDSVDETCRLRYLRAFRNLAYPDSVPLLLNHALNGTRKTTVAAMKALVALPKAAWDSKVIQACERIFLQLGRRYDSSTRTLSLDIILEAAPSVKLLEEVVLYLIKPDPNYEVKQYLLQRLRQISSKNIEFGAKLRDIFLKEKSKLFTYHALGQRGLTTAFTRSFLSSPSANGSLISIQEISGGLLKRGIVDVSVESVGESSSIFTLGLFAGGLSSFISSDSEGAGASSAEVTEDATAGMEIALLGTQIRPFVFFNGQGELMGHVWSGTASTRTPAFQALALLHDHRELLPLQTGFIADITLLGGMSFELAGEVQLSLWSRNAHSTVEKNAGLSLTGLTRVDSQFVKSQVEFNLATEPRLNLVSNLDFYSGMALCMQLKQPDTILKHNVYKVERIPGSKHRLRKSKYQVFHIPGRTYALNHKNNEMCNVIFKDQ